MATDIKKDLQLYFRIAKMFAFELPDEMERVKALKWIKKISTSKASQKLQTHVMFLLIQSLNRKRLVGPFEQMPTEKKELTKYKWTSLQPSDISKLLIQKEYQNAGKPSISLEVSGDLCEVVAYQEIPTFGAHFFYAYSPEKLHTWDNTDTSIIPKGLLNLTVISRPDLSILHKSLEVEMASKSKMRVEAEIAANAEERIGEFHDVSIVDSAGKMKEGFISEQPVANEALHMDALLMAQKSGIIGLQDILPEKDMMPQGEQINAPHMEEVSVAQCQQSLSAQTRTKMATQSENVSPIGTRDGRAAFIKAKEEMLARLQPRLRDKLTRKYMPQEYQQCHIKPKRLQLGQPQLPEDINISGHLRAEGVNETRIAIAKSLKQSMDINKLKNRMRERKGMPAVEERPDFPHLKRYLAMSTPTACDQAQHIPPSPTDFFASIERRYDDQPEMFYSNLSKEPSILQEGEMDDMFGSGMVAHPRVLCDPRMGFLDDEEMPSDIYESWQCDLAARDMLKDDMIDDEDCPSGWYETAAHCDDENPCHVSADDFI